MVSFSIHIMGKQPEAGNPIGSICMLDNSPLNLLHMKHVNCSLIVQALFSSYIRS